jgi:hypothetical protein
LVGHVLADRHAGHHVFLSLAQCLPGHVLGADAQPAVNLGDDADTTGAVCGQRTLRCLLLVTGTGSYERGR